MAALPKAAVAPDGTRYKVHYDRDWQEWQVRAFVNGKFHEGRTYYTGASGAEGREDAIQTFRHLVGATMNNPMRTYACWVRNRRRDTYLTRNHLIQAQNVRDARKIVAGLCSLKVYRADWKRGYDVRDDECEVIARPVKSTGSALTNPMTVKIGKRLYKIRIKRRYVAEVVRRHKGRRNPRRYDIVTEVSWESSGFTHAQHGHIAGPFRSVKEAVAAAKKIPAERRSGGMLLCIDRKELRKLPK